jgi:hypothetical protein
MSFAGLMNHRAVVYRATETKDELEDAVLVWTALPAPAGLNCRPNQDWSGNLQDNGPGEQQGAMRQWFLLPGFDVRERDVISIEGGAEAGLLLRVHSVVPVTAPVVVHHFEVNVEVWQGSLTEPAMES